MGALASLASRDRGARRVRPGGCAGSGATPTCSFDPASHRSRRCAGGQPVDAATLGGSCPSGRRRPPRAVRRRVVDHHRQLQGAAIHASILESDVVPAGPRYRPADSMPCARVATSGGWARVGWSGRRGRIAIRFREQLRLTRHRAGNRPDGPVHDALREHLVRTAPPSGRSFTPRRAPDERVVLSVLWDLGGGGRGPERPIAPLRAFLLRRPAKAARAGGKPRPGALRGPVRRAPSGDGRSWSRCWNPRPPHRGSPRRAMQLLQRHGC